MRDSTLDKRRRTFDDAIETIERNPALPLDLDTIAEKMGVTRRTLQRAFTEIGGTSFRAYAVEVKMRRARELLTQTDLTVREVGEHVGYRKPPQFCKTFKQEHGVTPTELRRAAE